MHALLLPFNRSYNRDRTYAQSRTHTHCRGMNTDISALNLVLITHVYGVSV